jgi:hypothetical protein
MVTNDAIMRASSGSFFARTPLALANCRSLNGLIWRTGMPAASKARMTPLLRSLDLQDIDSAELVAQDGSAGRGLLAIKRLEAAAGERRDRQRGRCPHHCSRGAWRMRGSHELAPMGTVAFVSAMVREKRVAKILSKNAGFSCRILHGEHAFQ